MLACLAYEALWCRRKCFVTRSPWAALLWDGDAVLVPVVIFLILARFCRFRIGESAGRACVCLCRVPFLPNVLFVPKRRQPGVRENLCSMNHSEVLPLVAPLSPAQRFAGEWTQITALSTSLLPTPDCFLAFVFPICFNLWCSLAVVHSCMPPNKQMVHKRLLPFSRISICTWK